MAGRIVPGTNHLEPDNPDESHPNLEVLDEPVFLSIEKRPKDYTKKECEHPRMWVSEDKAQVQCKDCGALLNPIAVLMRFATQATYWGWRRDELNKVLAELKERKRTQCEHCKRITRISGY